MPKLNGDIVPSSSGIAHLGINGGPGAGQFDITSLNPFGHIHMLSGIWHDTLLGQSGVLRFDYAGGAFQVSVDGGITFNDLLTGATVVSSIGVLGDANLTGDVDLASPPSGFIVIEDSSDASPLLFSVNQLGLSGLWGFPTQGFNGRVVNALTDFNGTESQGVVSVVGASGIVVDIVGQTMTISADGIVSSLNLGQCYSETFGAGTSVVITHNLGTTDLIVNVYDTSSPRLQIFPDDIEATDANTVTLSFNSPQAGRVVVIGC